MSKRCALLMVLGPCVIAVACLSALFARDAAPSNWKALETSYAKANLELAKARLAMAQSQNATVAETVSKEMLDALSAGVRVTEDRLRQLEAGQNANPFGPQILAAEGIINALEVNHNESLKANQLQAGAVSEFALRREQAEINAAKARLAALKSLAQQPPEVRIEWQIQLLQDDISALWARPLIEDSRSVGNAAGSVDLMAVAERSPPIRQAA